MNNKEEVDQKILQLKNSVKRIEAIAESLKALIPKSELNELLKIEFAGERFTQQTFGIFHTLEENAFDRLKGIYP